MSIHCIRLGDTDNVVVTATAVPRGTPIPDEGIAAKEDIPVGHKVATRLMAAGDPVLKYDQIMGYARVEIQAGQHVHEHNVDLQPRQLDQQITPDPGPPIPAPSGSVSFQGYRRANCSVGTRNYIGVITSVNCSATVAHQIADTISSSGELNAFPNVDGVVPIVHRSGCGMADSGEGVELLERTLAGYARHPNFFAVLLVGLGCEVLQLSRLNATQSETEAERYRSLVIQEQGGTRKTIDAGVGIVRDLLPLANACRRETIAASELKIGLQCGGSDAYSGISANPALGRAADLLVACGGTAILSETPEIYGAEQLLTGRAVSAEVGEKLLARLRWWEDYASQHGGTLNDNPSPGNRSGGLTTIWEKSLGAIAKAGKSPLVEVYRYGEPIEDKGLVVMDSPGYDPCSVTGQIASGANLICFTTGRGAVFGSKPAPTIKLSTNSQLFQRMGDEIDIDCGGIVTGDASIGDKGREIFALILDVASGQATRSEELGLGDQEFVPWQLGAVM